eukprot:CAMPEP_0168389926 /NCGR_PEP_ID=MMETSP0228-20121227/17212_1 /TAXON_ID=133427 /ORGANISM="Protoceratium reticulatum, Strain CCCM 535 (=CCMP 1889)" /LENGTH=474 /DNA_ID=CAMNT_0008403207 /DNA_START=45 /DNA_END=1469 /DNA_ORIENTATION=+
MAKAAFVAALLLAAPGRLAGFRGRAEGGPRPAYVEDCWQKRPPTLALASKAVALGHAAKLPGAGVEAITPFQTVLKDGFFHVQCAKDYLFNYGDKFGDGKYDYTMGQVANVSIVHYTNVVPKENRKSMTPEVCFEFCRTVPDMLVFGISNGRDCYCAPYFQSMAGDSSDCDAVCEGNPAEMCGGKFKSSIFEMHACADVIGNLVAASAKAAAGKQALHASIQALESVAMGMQTAAENLQNALGQAGDPAASNLMQEAKVFAGQLLEAGKQKTATFDALGKATAEAQSMANADFTDFSKATRAEDLTRKMEKLTVTAGRDAAELDKLKKAASPQSGADWNATGAAAQYYPVMYFADKEYVKSPTTCTGKPVMKPMFGTNIADCAGSCDAEVHSCVGFSFFTASPGNLCFLFSKLTEVTYYTGCQGAFLQKAASAPGLSCMAKLSEFEGTKIAPDASGKCKGCLRKATKADRCPGA